MTFQEVLASFWKLSVKKIPRLVQWLYICPFWNPTHFSKYKVKDKQVLKKTTNCMHNLAEYDWGKLSIFVWNVLIIFSFQWLITPWKINSLVYFEWLSLCQYKCLAQSERGFTSRPKQIFQWCITCCLKQLFAQHVHNLGKNSFSLFCWWCTTCFLK